MDLVEKESRRRHYDKYSHEKDRHSSRHHTRDRRRRHSRSRDYGEDRHRRKKNGEVSYSAKKYKSGNLQGSDAKDSCKYRENSDLNNSHDRDNYRKEYETEYERSVPDSHLPIPKTSHFKILEDNTTNDDREHDLSKLLLDDLDTEEEDDVEMDQEYETAGDSNSQAKFSPQETAAHEEEEEEEEVPQEPEFLRESGSTTQSNTDLQEDSKNVDDSQEDFSQDASSSIPDYQAYDENLPPYYPALDGCRSLGEFQCLNRIAEGTYGVVYRFRDKRTGEIVALKKLKMEKERDGFPRTSLREINTLLKGQHTNIVTVREIVVGNDMDKIFIVMDYIEHDIKSLIESMKLNNEHFTPGEVKCLLKQLLSAVAHLHDNWILHRDLKPANLLLSHKGVLKVGDFGLAREYGSPLRPYTSLVVTLWYRAPELLLGAKQYSTPIDVWSVGCIFAELLQMRAVFPGKSEGEQINRIFKCLGTPNERIWQGYSRLPGVQNIKLPSHQMSNVHRKFQMLSSVGLNFLMTFLTYDPEKRITAEDALKHPYFNEFPQPIDPSEFTKWPARSELSHFKSAGDSAPKPPPGGEENTVDEDGFWIGLEVGKGRRGGGFNLRF